MSAHPTDVRFSVSNLCWKIYDPSINELYSVGILNPKAYTQGERRVQALGGAALLEEAGRQHLIDRYGAHSFEETDARFRAPRESVEEITRFFLDYETNGELFELDPMRELIEELGSQEKYDKHSPVLSGRELARVTPLYAKTLIQPLPQAEGTSDRGKGQENRRIFRIHTLAAPGDVISRLRNSAVIRFLRDGELDTTNGGRCRGRTDDCEEIADNLWNE